MENSESDYSEDFEEEEVSSAAAPSSKPSLGSVSIRRRQHLGRGGGAGEQPLPIERAREKELSHPRDKMYETPSIRLPASQTTTKSKSTGIF